MKKRAYLCILVLIGVFSACKNPTDDITIEVYPKVFNYRTSIRVKDINGGGVLPGPLTVTIDGPDAGAVYSLDGTKNYSADAQGYIYLGINPRMEPTAAHPLEFNVKVFGAHILDVNIPTVITTSDLNNGVFKSIDVLNLDNPAPGTAVSTPSVTLAGNATPPTPTTIATEAKNGTNLITSITFPGSTQLRNAAGDVLTGQTLASTLVNLDVRSEAGLALFPGASLSSTNIVDESGNVITGTFDPAAVTDIVLTLGGQEVKTFSNPLTIRQDIDPTYFNTSTNATVAAGDVLKVYSYDVVSGQFKFETNATVINNAGKMAVEYPITHLTTWIVSNSVGTACYGPSVRFTGAWMKDTVSYPINITIRRGANVVLSGYFVNITKEANIIRLPAVPEGALTITVNEASGEMKELANQGVTITCGGTVDVALLPYTEQSQVTMLLSVRCPNASAQPGVIVKPTFDLYYRLHSAGTNADFLPLGVVTNGALTTTILDPAQFYDFKGVYVGNSKTFTKIVGNKQVRADITNALNVGNGEAAGYTYMGSTLVSQQNNLNMLNDACND